MGVDRVDEIAPERIKKRRDFIAARSGSRINMPAFTMQLRDRNDTDPALRFGFTVTKKTGNAVERNRIKRRLREASKLITVPATLAGHDIVLIARRSALEVSFEKLRQQMAGALAKPAKPRQKRRDAEKEAGIS